MRYVVTKSPEGWFTGFCREDFFLRNPAIFAEDSFEAFEGPEPDGSDESFDEVKRIAMALCNEIR